MHINLVGLMRSREVFGEDVDVFRPERFLDVDDEMAVRRRKVVDLNFGHGRWLCLGKALALLELNKIFVEVSRSCSSNDIFAMYPTYQLLNSC